MFNCELIDTIIYTCLSTPSQKVLEKCLIRSSLESARVSFAEVIKARFACHRAQFF